MVLKDTTGSTNGFDQIRKQHKESAFSEFQIQRKTKFVLCIDGGGVRGLIAAFLLTKLELELGYRISDVFDVIVGTSTGAMIAAGLSIRNS